MFTDIHQHIFELDTENISLRISMNDVRLYLISWLRQEEFAAAANIF
jgi:hypothetical protein